MRIGIFTSWVDTPFYTGVSYYICGLANYLPRTDRHEYTLVHFQEDDNKIYKRAKEMIFSFPAFLPETIKIELGVRRASHALDVIHIPWQVGFFLPVNCAKVITVHELTPIIFPEIQTRFWVFLHRYFMPRILKKVDMVITVSESTKRDLMKYMSVPETKIKTIYQGVDTEMYKVLPLSNIESIRRKYQLDFPYILYVGNIEPKKNIPTLLKAFSAVCQESRNNYRLVIVGKKLWKYQPTLNTVRALNLQDKVIFLGYVPENDLPGIYNAASLFVFPSIYEGFGRPLLEAMMCGVPVITSNSSSMPEVVGDAGITVDPYDVPALAMAINQVLTDDKLRTTLTKKGLERAKFFSWQKCAEETLAVYEEAHRKANY
ncbi:glycosyltransferase family 4 protein [Chloroflexota bacterium]